MSKTAFIFPGQGAQYVGMGKDFYENIPVCKEVFEMATKAAGFSIEDICFEENDKINITEYTQIAMLATEVAIITQYKIIIIKLATEIAMYKALEEKGIKPDVTAGLSLGEYGALAVAGVFSLEDSFKVVRQRGILMQNAVPEGGAMTAVLGLDGDVIAKICEETEGIVSVANYNCPGQIVITGEEKAVDEAAEKLKEAGAKRCVKLNVSGPFHSAMLKEAGENLGNVIDEVTIGDIQVPYITNVTADYVTDKNQVKEMLMKQVASSVKWQQTIERMIADGVDTFIEIGPGKTLAGFMRKIDKTKKVYNLEKLEDLDKITAALEGEA